MLEVLQLDRARPQLLQVNASVKFDNVQVADPPLGSSLDGLASSEQNLTFI